MICKLKMWQETDRLLTISLGYKYKVVNSSFRQDNETQQKYQCFAMTDSEPCGQIYSNPWSELKTTCTKFRNINVLNGRVGQIFSKTLLDITGKHSVLLFSPLKDTDVSDVYLFLFFVFFTPSCSYTRVVFPQNVHGCFMPREHDLSCVDATRRDYKRS